MSLNQNQKRCAAKSKSTGRRCKNPAAWGFSVCRLHGAHPPNGRKAGRPKGISKPKGSGGPPPRDNQNAKKHGAYSTRLSPEEKAGYESIRTRYEKGFNNLSEIDRDCIHRLVLFEMKLESAIESGAPGDALEPLQRMIHRELKVLQATREAKDANVMTGNSPAEVIAALFVKARRLGLEGRGVPVLPGDSEIIDAEVVEIKPV